MTMGDLVAWRRFEDEFGPLTIQERLDHGFAMLAWLLVGKQGDPADYLPEWGPAPEPPSMFEWLQARARKAS